MTSTADAGAGTLRQAILDANAHPGSDSVRFNLPGSGVRTIGLTSAALPTVTEKVVINGKSQPGYAGSPLVRVDNASANQLNGLRIQAAQSEVLGLELTRFAIAIRVLGDANKVQGNLIGTDAAGDGGLGNATGVRVESGAGNKIGGIAQNAPNVISGNTNYGVELTGSATTATTVSANKIGTNPAGTAALANGTGVRVGGGSSGNVIGGLTTAERNLISGNQQYGVRLLDAGTTQNTVEGNYVGTTANGASALTNGTGISVDTSAAQNTIGGSSGEARNVISGNTALGVRIDGSGTTGNTIAGNYVGTTSAGTAKLANGSGIRVSSNSSGNTIGGITAGARNVISGNDCAGNAEKIGHGVEFISGAVGNTVAGNYIGTNAAGSAALSNCYGVYIGYPSGPETIGVPGAGNVISGNYLAGAYIRSTGNVVQANYIGTDASGTAKISQSSVGVCVCAEQQGRADYNTIGGTTAAERNVISGNGYGAVLAVTAHNTITGNYIGTDATGTAPLGNTKGVSIYRSGENTIGGNAAGARNVISANSSWGVSMNRAGRNDVTGNYIGVDVTGSADLGNGAGVTIQVDQFGGAARNGIDDNVISGNTGYGVTFDGSQSGKPFFGNAVDGNYIGTNAAGDAAIPNGGGVHILEGPYTDNNTIGCVGTCRNVISGNAGWGVVISENSYYVEPSVHSTNYVTGNYIGTKAGGGHPLGNGGGGVLLELGAKDESIEANKIAFNGGPGVAVDGTPDINGFVASRDSILGNSIYNNGGLGIDLLNGGNNDQAAPVITAVTVPPKGWPSTIDGTLDSTPSTSFRIELFTSFNCDPSGAGEGKVFLTSTDVTTDGAGHATFSTTEPYVITGQYVTATATNSATGDTSEFSVCFKSP